MNWSIRTLRRRISFLLSVMMLLSLMNGLFPFGTLAVAEELTYKFTHAGFDDQPVQEGWKILGELPGVPNTRYQVYGAQIQPSALNQFREFEFQVPETGYYTLQLSGFEAAGGGLAAIFVDDAKVGEHNFYGTPNGYGPKQTLKTIHLSAGTHILKIQVIQSVGGRAMYPSEFTLIKKDGPAQIATLAVQLEMGLQELYTGQAAALLLDAQLDDGTKIAIDELSIAYLSSDPSVATVSDGVVTAHGVGTSSITVEAMLDSATITETIEIRVVEFAELTYKFTHAGFPGHPTQSGWNILGELPGVPNTRHQAYGAQIQPTALNQFREFEFYVPMNGYYTIQLSGFLAAAGGLGALYVDAAKIGEYNFYGTPNDYGPKNSLKTVYLSEGMHIFKIEVIQVIGSRAMYPSELTLVKKDGPAQITSVSTGLETGIHDMLIGQSSSLIHAVQLDDGTFAGAGEFTFTYESSDPTVVSVIDRIATAHSAGESVIIATFTKDGSSMQTELPIRVLPGRLDSLDFSIPHSPLIEGQTINTTVTGILDDGTTNELKGITKTYSIDDPTIAMVSEEGEITALGAGSTTIHVTVQLGDIVKSAALEIAVIAQSLQAITFSVEPTPLMLGMKGQALVSGLLNNGQAADLSTATIQYNSDDESIITINEEGVLTTHSIGHIRVTVEVTLGSVTRTDETYINVISVQNDKTHSTYYTDEKVSAARENIALYDWAASQRDASVTAAQKYIDKGMEFLWNSVPGQSLPRSYQTNQTLGNLSPLYFVAPSENPLNKLGNYPWVADPLNHPWKLTDPTSGYQFPTNDFGAYYESGLNEHGIFDPELADRGLLVNTLYPEKGPDWGVDDGFGWVDPETGYRYTFIAYYNHWFLWYGGTSIVQNGLASLTNAYLYTGDPKYAQAGTVLLDRIADLYPDMDVSQFDAAIYLNSHGGTGLGKAVGSIWETGLVKTFIGAYDAFFPGMDDDSIIQFLTAKGQKYDLPLKNSVAGIRKNMEDGILRQTFEGFKTAQIRGNNGYHQSALAMAAVVLNKNPETKEWLDYTFQTGAFLRNPDRITGGNILNTLVNDVDRDGHGNEASPGYNSSWLTTYLQVADMLEGYELYPAADLYQNVKIQKMFHAMYPLTMVEKYTVQIGDTASTGNPGVVLNKDQAIKAFQLYGDPIFAQIAYMLNNNNVTGIHSNIFTRNPNQIAHEIDNIIKTQGMFRLDSDNLTGYGLATLRDGANPTFDYSTIYHFSQLPVVEHTQDYRYFPSNGAIQFEAVGIGDAIAFTFNVGEGDEYEISLRALNAPSYGQYAISLDGSPLLDMDFFGSGQEHRSLGIHYLTTGEHTLRFEVIGKHESSSNYKIAFFELALLDEEERQRRDAAQLGNTLRDVWMYYGRNTGHGHRDTLNLGLHAFGLDLMPELGYPEQANATDAHRHEWVNNVISHNTVLVDQRKPQGQIVAQPQQFDDAGIVKVMDVEAPNIYPQTDLYKRTTAMIQVDEVNSYAVDFFRIDGGNEHHFSFHGAEGAVTTEGLNLIPQSRGTYAGESTEFGVRPANDSVAGSGYVGPGFHWLGNVERDVAPSQIFSVDYDIVDTWNAVPGQDDVHLRLTMLGEVDDVALADGVPPRNKPGNPETLRYMIAHRGGENISSLFTSVIEPYKAERYIRSIEPAAVTRNGTIIEEGSLEVRAVKVELVNGRIDYIISALDPTVSYMINGKLSFKGTFGVYSEQAGQQIYAYINEGTEIGPLNGELLQQPQSAITGSIIDFTKELSRENSITVQMSLNGLDPEKLVGRFLYAEHDGTRNAAYKIKAIESLGHDQYDLNIGDITFIRSYRDNNDFSQGFIYDIQEGAAFRIPLSTDRHLTTTRAIVEGTAGLEDWYVSDVTITLEANILQPGIAQTEYALSLIQPSTVTEITYGLSSTVTGITYGDVPSSITDGFIPYTEPITLTDGVYELSYRSLNRAGQWEATKQQMIRIDKLAPSFQLQIDGIPITEEMNVNHTQPFTLTLLTADNLSGVANGSILVDGYEFVMGDIIDWAGQPGTHHIQVMVTDQAGNEAIKQYTLSVGVSIDSMDQLIERYILDGQLDGPLVPQLKNGIRQARHHLEGGRMKQAIKHLEDVIKHANNKALQDRITNEARDSIVMNIQYLIQTLQQ